MYKVCIKCFILEITLKFWNQAQSRVHLKLYGSVFFTAVFFLENQVQQIGFLPLCGNESLLINMFRKEKVSRSWSCWFLKVELLVFFGMVKSSHVAKTTQVWENWLPRDSCRFYVINIWLRKLLSNVIF